MNEQDYSSMNWYSQPAPVASWAPQSQQVMFPFANQSPSPANYGFSPAYGSTDPGLRLGNASLATPKLDALATGNTPPGGGNWWDGFLGTRDQQGWGGLAIGGAQALMNGMLGWNQLQQAKDSLAFQKDAFNKQFTNNVALTNSRLEDRQRARVASNAGAYQSVGDYMAQNGVK